MPAPPEKDELELTTRRYRIPATTSVTPWTPHKIIHKVLTIRKMHDSICPNAGMDDHIDCNYAEVDFKVIDIDTSHVPASNIRSYAAGLGRAHTHVCAHKLFPAIAGDPLVEIAGMDPSQYDIKVSQQCYVIIELDGHLNWRFKKGAFGVTTKEYYASNNFALKYVDGGGVVSGSDHTAPVNNDTCKVLYFAVAKREDYQSQYFNFEIEFIGETGGQMFLMPTIFDPDIPNTGGSFP